MVPQIEIFDQTAIKRHRCRAAKRIARLDEVLDTLAERILIRLDDTNRQFRFALDFGGRGAVARFLAARGIAVVSSDITAAMVRRAAGLSVVMDVEKLPFAEQKFDLIVAHLALHWTNDLPGALIQLRRALRPGGLFLASIPVAGTLGNLRTALLDAELELSGRAAPRIAPFPDLLDCAALLQRADFTLPVAELDVVEFEYRDPTALLADLRDAGETNAMINRSRTIPPRSMFSLALAKLSSGAERCKIVLRLAILTGWAS